MMPGQLTNTANFSRIAQTYSKVLISANYQVEISQEMINIKQAEAEKRRSAVSIFKAFRI